MTRPTWQQRLWAKVATDANGCWIWTAAINHNGYGLFLGPRDQGMPAFNAAHRWAFVAAVGPIPEGMTLDHLCYVRACVNPAHLEPVTIEENIRRATSRRTGCKRGHAYTPENTYVGSDGYRKCRRCKADRRAERVANAKQVAA